MADTINVTHPRPAVHIDKLNTNRDLEVVQRSVGRLARQANEGEAIDVEFSSPDSPQSRPYSPQWSAVLSNLLMGKYADVAELTVHLPQSSSARLQLARAGLLFALSRHKGLDRSRSDKVTVDSLDRWSEDWTPADFDEPLFRFAGEDLSVQPKNLEADLLAFLNPNYAPRGSDGEDLGAVTYPWLRSIFSKARIPDVNLRHEMMRDASFVTTELLNNIRDHSGIGYDGLSHLSMFATGTKADDARIYIHVSDNGVGMPATLNGKSEKTDPEGQVKDALDGSLRRRERGRGDGLSAVRSMAEKYKGSLFVATGPTDENRTVIVDHDFSDDDDRLKVSSYDIPVQGTVVVVSLPIAKLLVR